MLRPDTFFKDFPYAFDFFEDSLFSPIAAIHSLNKVSVSVFYGSHPFLDRHYVAFVRFTTFLQSFAVTYYHYHYSLSLVSIRCHSLSLDVLLACLFINNHLLSKTGFDI